MQVKYVGLSLHTDSKGILDLTRHVAPRHVVLVHGEPAKMRCLVAAIQAALSTPCYMPRNGEALRIALPSVLPVEVSPAALRAAVAAAGRAEAEAALQVVPSPLCGSCCSQAARRLRYIHASLLLMLLLTKLLCAEAPL